MNTISKEKKQTIIHLLLEGNSMRLMVKVGDKCRAFLDERMRGLNLKHIQADEIWTFVYAKQHHIPAEVPYNSTIGDQFLFIAFDEFTKLIPTFAIGKRTAELTRVFINDLADRIVTDYPQLSTDGFPGYLGAVKSAFGDEVAYGQIIKDFAEPEQPGRYGPPSMIASSRKQLLGLEDIDPRTICTSHVERNNLNLRTFIKRFTRLTLGFSKKLENLAAAVALFIAYHNYCRVPRSLRISPAMAAGIADHVWELDELLAAL